MKFVLVLLGRAANASVNQSCDFSPSHWLYGEVVGRRDKSGYRVKGWFPKSCVIEVLHLSDPPASKPSSESGSTIPSKPSSSSALPTLPEEAFDETPSGGPAGDSKKDRWAWSYTPFFFTYQKTYCNKSFENVVPIPVIVIPCLVLCISARISLRCTPNFHWDVCE